MRTPDIEFVRPRGHVFLWGALAGVTVVLAVSMGLYAWYHAEQTRLQGSINELEQKIAALSSKKDEAPRKEVPSWLHEAEVSLGTDWNVLYGRLEGLSVQGVRLASLQAAVLPWAVRVEFELDGWGRVPELNEALNPEGQQERWELISVAPAAGGSGSGAVRAVWVK